jgi:hypothetical protein
VAQLFALEYGTAVGPSEWRQSGGGTRTSTDQELVWTDCTAQRVGAQRPCEPDWIERTAELQRMAYAFGCSAA